MLDNYKHITITHRSLNVEDLGRLIIRYNDEAQLVNQLESVKTTTGQEEVLYLNTCNLIVFLFYGEKPLTHADAVSLFRTINPDFTVETNVNLEKVVRISKGKAAITEVLELVSSIDSLVVGEREIFRQFRAAYDFGWKNGLCGDRLRLLEKTAVRAAKDVYTNTAIGAKPVSVASLAIQSFLSKNVDRSERILLVGAGETNRTIGRFLKKHGYGKLCIFNRSLNNAKELSDELGAEARHLGDLECYSDSFGALFTSTSAQEPIITETLWSGIAGNESKVIIDLSIPHNVERSVAQLPTVSYTSIDSIRVLAEDNLKYRRGNIAAARMILGQHLDEFHKMYERRKVQRAFRHLPTEIKSVKDRALNKVYKDQISTLSPEVQDLIQEIANYMERKCVAVPMRLVNEAASTL
ncbi:MAG: glutamyl-tRNA reductase [Bacteroidota bacterium]